MALRRRMIAVLYVKRAARVVIVMATAGIPFDRVASVQVLLGSRGWSRHLLLAALAVLFVLTGCGGGGSAGGGAGGGGTGGGGSGGSGLVSAKVTWMAPTRKTDGSTLDNLAGYRIYYNSTGSGLWNEVEVKNPSAITWTIDGLQPGIWYFMMTAVNDEGAESDHTQVVSTNLK
jgi:hypothetical protein